MSVTHEMRDMAMDLAISLAAEHVAERTGCSCTEAVAQLLSSEIGQAVYDDGLKLWWESPVAIADAFLRTRPR